VTALFSESSGRLIVEVRPRSIDAFMKIMGRSAARLGTVTDDSLLSILGVEPIPVGRLADAFNSPGAR
jgi:phosphoribosylformylglycinamidine (FGAM) synthase-like enzyme